MSGRLERLRRALGTLVLDAEGRVVFRPWSMRSGYVLPDARSADDVWRRLARWGLGWFAVIFVVGVLTGLGDWSGWLRPEMVVLALAVVHYAWLVRRWTRGLERVRYEPPPR